MTISSENSSKLYTGNGVTTVFAYDFKINNASDLEVIIADLLDVQTAQVLDTDYSVSGVGDDGGGNITFLIAPPTNGFAISIKRAIPLTQLTDLQNQGGFFAETHEDTFDLLVMMTQQQQEELNRTPKVTETSGDTGDAFIDTINTAVSAAGASATAAATSETNAETAETNAETAETNAETAETNAETAETNAAASAAAASTSETNAATSETNAATSASNAATSETNAATSASNASGAASAASASASASSTSASNAATSEANAATSETNAATSETNAAASAAELPTIVGGDATKILQVNAGETGYDKVTHITDSAAHGRASALVGISDAQVITNKDFEGGTASDTNRTTLPKNTTSNLLGLVRKEGTVFYDTDKAKFQGDNGTKIVDLGGGAAGDGSTIDLVQAKDLLIADIDLTGNNADFDGGGAIVEAPTLSSTAAELILTEKVIRYSANGSNGQNDYFGFTKDIPQGLRGRVIGFIGEYKNDSTTVDNDFRYAVKIKDGANAGLIEYLDLEAFEGSNNTSQPFQLGVFIPSDCTQVETGFQNTTATTTVKLFADNLLIDSNPFSFKDIQGESESYTMNTGTGNFWDLATSTLTFDTSLLPLTNSNLVEYDDTTQTRIVAKRRIEIFLTVVGFQDPNGDINIFNSSGTIISRSSVGSGTDYCSTTAHVVLESGDYLYAENTNPEAGRFGGINILATPNISSHVVTPAKSNLSDWESYTPIFTGFGTPTNVDIKFKQVGDSFHIRGTFAAGTTTAVEARIGLPNSKAVAANSISPIGVGGVYFIDKSTASNGGSVLITPGDTFLNLSQGNVFNNSVVNAMTPVNASTSFGSGDIVVIDCLVHIEGLDSNAQFLALIPVEQIAYLKGEKASATDGGTFTSGAWQTRELNAVSGDSSIVSLSSNQFTLGPGKYAITGLGVAYFVRQHKVKLRNITDSTDDIIGTTAFAQDANNTMTTSVLEGTIEITATKTFELQHRCLLTKTSNGFGTATAVGVNEIYAQVAIRKIS